VGDFAVDYDAPETPYRQIAGWIRSRIESGELTPGRRLPSEQEIQQITGCARTTTRRAYRLLEREGIAYTVPGRGSYAGKRPDA
jgi:GntR family transcriptional regulator